MDLHHIELHDARLLAVAVDPIQQSVDLRLAYYPGEQSSERVYGSLKFRDVTAFSQVVDLHELAQHHGPGNVSHWNPSPGGGTTFVHLVQGLIVVTASSVEMVND